MKKVAILMSTYNGDAYIEEQIESIMQQSYEGCELHIRDDGSKAPFVNKLKELQKRYQFTLYLGDNKGFLQSFFWLLRKVEDAEYYAFSDQDDVWLPDKIENAVEWLEQENDKIPLLYHGAYSIQDEEGKEKGTFQFPNQGYDFRRSITENHYSGFAMVVNQTMRECLLQANLNKIVYHDWWAANIAQGFGKAYFDERICAIHRAHEHNVTKITLARRIHWFIESCRRESEIHSRMTEYERLFEQKLSAKDQQVLRMFTHLHYHLPTAVKKCFYPKRWRPVLSSEVVMRVLMLVGKV